MKKIRKIFAVLLSLAMVLGMSMTTFAAETTNKSNVVVSGVVAEKDNNNIKVEAYQIITYDESGKYVPVIKGSIATDAKGNLSPTASNLLALAEQTGKLTKVELIKAGDDYVSNDTDAKLTAGSWMILVKGSVDYVYNPAVVSIQVSPEGYVYGELNLAEDSFTDHLYLKRSEPTITKTAEKADVEDTEIQGVQFGDILKFTIKTTVPSYPTTKSDILYTISDQLTGLSLVKTDDEGKYPVTVTGAGAFEDTIKKAVVDGANSISAVLEGDDEIRNIGGNTITITYFAKVTTEAKINVDKANNKATLDYSTSDGTGSKSSETNHYTFGIGTTVNGTYGSGKFDKTGEFIKTDDKGTISYVENAGDIIKTEGTELLDGAEFQLHIGAADGALFKNAEGKTTFKTTSDGRLEINGLDSDVTYYLVETKAPTGYTVNSTPVEVKITASFDDNGILTGYVVKIGDATTNYGYKDNGVSVGDTTLINTPETANNPYQFKNTKLSNLPSTGGIGTTIFTIGGCLIMIVAAGLFFASRRKSAK